MVTRELLREVKGALLEYGADPADAAFETALILERAGISRIAQLAEPNAPVAENSAEKARDMLRRRTLGEPLQYILGKWEFCGFEFDVGEGVLIPRSDTETLVEVCGDYLGGRRGALAADLCAGSGCVGVALARLFGCRVKSYELSRRAYSYLEKNIAANGGCAEPICADVLCAQTVESAPMFDIIAANPPYLTQGDMNALQREVGFEPKMALFGGADGLDFYRALLPLWTQRLCAGGLFAVEIGMGQEKDVAEIFSRQGLSPDFAHDSSGIIRVVFAVKKTLEM